MKAAVCTKYGPPNVLKIRNYRNPSPKKGEVLIQVHAASVTNSDIFIRGANLPLSMQIPMRIMLGLTKPRREIIGEVLSGKVVGLGEKVTKFRTGDMVYGLTGFSLGAYAELACLGEGDSKRGCIALKPKNVSHEDATGLAYGGLLALQQLEKMDPDRHKKILVYGASGTTGVFAIQYLLDQDYDLTAVCSGKNIDLISTLGVEKVLDYTNTRSVDQLERYDIVFDAVGKAKSSTLKEAARRSLTARGQYLSIDSEALKLDSSRLDRIRHLVEAGTVRPINDRIYSLDDIVKAHEYVESGHKVGNVALTISD